MTATLNRAQLLLLEERDRIQREIEQASLSQKASVGRELATNAEDGSETFDEELRISIRSDLEATLQEIQHALNKISMGNYGRCDACGQAIPPARLEVLPHAALCVACKHKLEHGIRAHAHAAA